MGIKNHGVPIGTPWLYFLGSGSCPGGDSGLSGLAALNEKTYYTVINFDPLAFN